MLKNNFLSHFTPFQINIQLFSSTVPSGSGPFQMPTCPSTLTSASTLRRGRANFINTLVFFLFFLAHFAQNTYIVNQFSVYPMTFYLGWHWKVKSRLFGVHWAVYHRQCIIRQRSCQAERPFWMPENHFWSHISPFQIKINIDRTSLYSMSVAASNMKLIDAFLIKCTSFFII